MAPQIENIETFIENVSIYSTEAMKTVRDGLRSFTDSNEIDKGLLTRLMSDDNLLCRYMKRRRGDPSESIKFIVNTLQWRHDLGLDNLDEQTFPKELYESGGLFISGQDIQGNSVLHIRVSHFYKIPELVDLVKKFVVHHMYKADELGSLRFPSTGGWILVFDCSNASLAQGDPEMLSFINYSLKNYFPSGQKYIVIINLNWVLRAIKSLAFTWYPAAVKNRIKFCSSKEITDYIPKSELPDYLGGPVKQYRQSPKNCITLDSLRSKGQLSGQSYDKIMRILAAAN
ncbi:motile sperm domain-containing protein 2-like [Tetranychus urticae]|uniref:CRAL-TRIO domain-containing protein n=1 Tax=Tetranychus urticae TaxID=32264 RepID=T1L4P5_TETUR|nr:motile sperm domain-containing protein 2-like [Tetranychus urticae]XP_015786831.1 motile sperm domain-containing protein 2-like [Tetranychus urticae]